MKTWLLLICLMATFAANSVAGDWPQVLGPERNGITVGEKLLPKWPQSGPRVEWQADVGEGFAGVAAKAGRVYLFHREGSEESLQCMQAATGDSIWSSESACRYSGSYASDNGPRCVPLVTDTHVFVFGVAGTLRCVDVTDGKEVWKRETWKDFGAPEGYFGAGSSPLLVDDLLIVNVGGRGESSVVAFSVKDGSTIWQSFKDAASYSSPVLTTVDGVQHALVVTRMNTLSLNPKDGSLRFKFPFGMRGPTVNGATPVVLDGHLFVSSSYRVGSVWAKISSTSATSINSGEKLLATQYATPIEYQGLFYAVDGRQDTGQASVKCIDPFAQKVIWEQRGFDYGTMIRVDDQLILLTCQGDLYRIAADKSAYKELHRSKVLQSTPRGYRLPAISNGRLFVRDDSTLKCLQVGVSK